MPLFLVCLLSLAILPSGLALAAAARVVLSGNHPDPFNPRTTIRFTLPAAGRATLTVFDASGRCARTLLNAEVLAAGEHARIWDGRDDAGLAVGSGVSLCRLVMEQGVESRKMTLTK